MGQQVQVSTATVYTPEEDTLDESVCATIMRDVFTIGRNLRSVLIPINWKASNRDQALRNWDLWGPLVSVHGCLASTRTQKAQLFTAVEWAYEGSCLTA
jgi:hypothetical protein